MTADRLRHQDQSGLNSGSLDLRARHPSQQGPFEPWWRKVSSSVPAWQQIAVCLIASDEAPLRTLEWATETRKQYRALVMIRLCAACRKTSVSRTTGTAPEPITSANTCPGPTDGSGSISPTIRSAASFGTAFISAAARTCGLPQCGQSNSAVSRGRAAKVLAMDEVRGLG
jgi:hypothetical protein